MPTKSNAQYIGRAVILSVLLGGCQAIGSQGSVAETSQEPAYYQQLVLKFKPEQGGCNDEGVTALAKVSGVRLERVRPVERGNGCVVKQFADNPDYFLAQRRILSEYADIQWVEQDERVAPF